MYVLGIFVVATVPAILIDAVEDDKPFSALCLGLIFLANAVNLLSKVIG